MGTRETDRILHFTTPKEANEYLKQVDGHILSMVEAPDVGFYLAIRGWHGEGQ